MIRLMAQLAGFALRACAFMLLFAIKVALVICACLGVIAIWVATSAGKAVRGRYGR